MNLLITGFLNWTEDEMNTLRQMGHTLAFQQYENGPLTCDPTWVEGVIGNSFFIHHPIEQFIHLKYIQLTSVGFDRVPMDVVKSRHIEIHNAHDVYTIPMAEFVLSGILHLYKQWNWMGNNQKNHTWKKCRNILELSGKTACIIGCGHVGMACAQRLKAMGCHLIGVNRSPISSNVLDQTYPLSALNDALSLADIVVVSVALTDETRHLIHDEQFQRMKTNALLVNVARGPIVDTNALMNALKTKLFGAVLDVFEEEPLGENHPLWEMENVLLTPHNSFVGEGNHQRMWQVIVKNLMHHPS